MDRVGIGRLAGRFKDRRSGHRSRFRTACVFVLFIVTNIIPFVIIFNVIIFSVIIFSVIVICAPANFVTVTGDAVVFDAVIGRRGSVCVIERAGILRPGSDVGMGIIVR